VVDGDAEAESVPIADPLVVVALGSAESEVELALDVVAPASVTLVLDCPSVVVCVLLA